MKKNFCILPWVSLSLGTDGQVHPCCQVLPFSKPDQLKDYLHSELQKTPQLGRMREEFLNNQFPSECSQCFKLEENGGASMRKIKNQFYQDVIEKTSFSNEPLDLLEFDVRFSNNCQLSCLTCEPLFSTSWYQHDPENPISKNKRALRSFENSKQVEDFFHHNNDSLKLVTITGGEPLLEPLALEFFDKAKDHLEININTGLMLPESLLIKNLVVLKRFSNLKIAISLDGIEERAEKIRRGLDWKLFISNLNKVRDVIGGEKIYFHVTCSNLNAGHISEILYWVEKNYPESFLQTTINFVHAPEAFNPKSSDQSQKQKWIDSNNNFMKNHLFQSLSDEKYQRAMALIALVHSFLKN